MYLTQEGLRRLLSLQRMHTCQGLSSNKIIDKDAMKYEVKLQPIDEMV